MDVVNADIATLPSELQTSLGTESLQPCVTSWAAQATGDQLFCDISAIQRSMPRNVSANLLC